MKRPEQAIQIGIMNYLRQIMDAQRYKKFMAFHVPNGGGRSEAEGRILKKMGVMAGVADIVVLVPPIFNLDTLPIGHQGGICNFMPMTVFIELKHQPMRIAKRKAVKGRLERAPAKVLSTPQEDFQQRVNTLGFNYRTVAAVDARDGLNQVLTILSEYGVKAS